ncbi:Cytochrome c oxidase copper chaperone [Rhynchospora pubera]|uniref:Cytochrome c oxidase copper chaperone n=1 Tax=Rhynchospora pubera TaxID=906938 RepID=A0AAV8C5H7_9POAL|nr:Cytochrome c oxidase copper chaperone [Rhynchospora pubera]
MKYCALVMEEKQDIHYYVRKYKECCTCEKDCKYNTSSPSLLSPLIPSNGACLVCTGLIRGLEVGRRRLRRRFFVPNCETMSDNKQVGLLLSPELSENGHSTANTSAPPADVKPKKKICCACPDTKRLRDECIVEHGEAACTKWIEAHKQCLRAEGFNV